MFFSNLSHGIFIFLLSLVLTIIPLLFIWNITPLYFLLSIVQDTKSYFLKSYFLYFSSSSSSIFPKICSKSFFFGILYLRCPEINNLYCFYISFYFLLLPNYSLQSLPLHLLVCSQWT